MIKFHLLLRTKDGVRATCATRRPARLTSAEAQVSCARCLALILREKQQKPAGWKLYKPTDTDPFFHVAPNFGRKHELDVGVHCWCQPTPDSEAPNKLLIHHEEH